jgi:beta-glucosidase
LWEEKKSNGWVSKGLDKIFKNGWRIKMKAKKSAVRKWRGLTCVFASTLAVVIAGSMICETWKDMIDSRTGTVSSKIVSKTSDKSTDLYTYKSDYSSTAELVNAHKSLAEQIQEEGCVLLKNDGSALPLKKGSKVTLLGMRSQYSSYGGQIGSSAVSMQNVSLETALKEKGFSVNPTMVNIYSKIGSKVTGTQLNFFTKKSENVYGFQPGTLSTSFFDSNNISALKIGEPSLSQYQSVDSAYADSFSKYNDAAIVVIGRPSTEAADFYPGKSGMAEDEGATSILGLTTNEKNVIALAESKFDNVVVLINSDNPMEIQDLKDDAKIDSILWVGEPGNYGFLGVADVLNGTVSPSGHLYDTYAADSTSSPAMANYGLISYANQDDISTSKLTYTDYRAGWYEVEAEGIYTGYKYYETRYADAVAGAGNAASATGSSNGGAWNYADEVSYGFGYGLSYTTFEQTLGKVSFNSKDHTATVNVTVKNTGKAVGKDTVQLYAQSPYTAYDKQNKVEKAAVQLLGFEKTKELQPGESAEVTVTVDLQYLASYDYTNAKTYIMDAGNYYFAIGNGSHDALNNILASQGKTTSDGMDYSGNANNAYKWTQNNFDSKTYSKSANGTKVTNQLDNADLNYYESGTVTYLSRSDWKSTWPKTYSGISANSKLIKQLRNDTYTIAKNEDTSTIFPEKSKSVTLTSLKGASFTDSRWNFLLNQLTLDEACYGIRYGGTKIKALKSIGSFDVWEADGPIGFSDFKLGDRSTDKSSPTYIKSDDSNAKYSTCDMPTEPVVGAAFNKDLANKEGALFGNDSLWNNTPVLWAPGMNTHRTPYNGRNHEYYSEDSMLTNYLGTAAVKGANSKGLILSPKHFAFNDQETNRIGLCEFMNEQKARECDLRAFQGAFEGGALGTMTSFNRIGATYVNAHEGLMKNILRSEWGFKGLVATDMVNGENYITVKESTVYGGASLMLASSDDYAKKGAAWEYFTADGVKGDATLCTAIRENYHYLLYALANSNAMNGISGSSYIVNLMTWWRALFIALEALFAILIIISLIGYIRAVKKAEIKEVAAV